MTIWMTLSKTNQKQKDNYCTISLVSGIIWEKERENETKRKENQPKASSQRTNQWLSEGKGVVGGSKR